MPGPPAEFISEVFDRCLSGANSHIDLQQLEGALDNANGVIARVCELGRTLRPAPSDPVDVS